MKIRLYTLEDKEAVIQLLNTNTPKFFDESEKEDFKNYLENEVEDYFVVEENHQIIGAGGINYFLKEKIARISWGLISPDLQGKGIGSKLTRHRIQHLNKNKNVNLIIVRTSQHTYKFYEKMGFKIIKIETGFWADGYDLYHMEQKNKNE